MTWTPAKRQQSHRSARHRQAVADQDALPVIRAGLRRYDSLRRIAAALDNAGIEPPGSRSLNGYGAEWRPMRPRTWSAQAVSRIMSRHRLDWGPPPVGQLPE